MAFKYILFPPQLVLNLLFSTDINKLFTCQSICALSEAFCRIPAVDSSGVLSVRWGY